MKKRYVGRFAPSPSGPLHMGSLVTALGSYLQAKVHDGKWLLRIDDIDPPRMIAGSSEGIQATLSAHGLNWDGDPVFQSNNYERYEKALNTLHSLNATYPCVCTRAQIKVKGDHYTGTCRDKHQVQGVSSLRFKNDSCIRQIYDDYLGMVSVDPAATGEDFIVKRKDGLYAYYLASVADDIAMGITEIVRGEDLLLPTACQWSLFNALGATPPSSMHLPLVTLKDGRKLSKQNGAVGLDCNKPLENLTEALAYLNIVVSKTDKVNTPNALLELALELWRSKTFPVTD